MILLILVVVIAVALAGAGLLGIGALSEEHHRGRSGWLALLSAPVVLVLGIVLLAALVLGLGGSGPEHGTTTTTPPARPRTEGTQPQPLQSARVATAAANIPVVLMEAAEEDRFAPYRPVSGLARGAVVRVQARGFGEFESGDVEQCVSELGRQTACGEAFPVQFDDRGGADFQFAVRGDVAPDGCRAGTPTCLLRLTGKDSGRQATVQTVLVDQLIPGKVNVEPPGPLVDGQTVGVSVTGFPAGATATAVLCAPPAAYDARRCTSPDPTSAFPIDSVGAGRTTLVVAAGRLGADGALCGPRRACGIAVLVGGGFIAAPVTPVDFSLGPGVAYDTGRLLAGLLVAVVLIAAAVAIAVRTDWTKPTEAATPALDRADLRTDLNLDELFGTDRELDERDPIPW